MIKRIRHKGLRSLYDDGIKGGVKPAHVDRLTRILSMLDAAQGPQDLNSPALGLHPLRGEMKGHYAISVSGNWRITFRFEGQNVTDVQYLDYH